MKLISVFTLSVILLFGCKKSKFQTAPSTTSYYWPTGNFLILIVGDTLEEVYEYDLVSTELTNDSLPIIIENVTGPTSMFDYNYWRFTPNDDTLFWTLEQSMTWMEEKIDPKTLWTTNNPIQFDTLQFQGIFSSSNFNFETIWDQISDLEIVKVYRSQNPTSKIGISKNIIWHYDETLGFAIPHEKHLVFLAR